MDALLLAAGLGTRLRPLTNDRPKALVTIGHQTLLEINIQRLIRSGYHHIIVNVHHFATMMKDYIASHSWNADIEISDESDLLLNTGGALKKAATLLRGDSLLVYNVDILSTFDLGSMHHQHNTTGNWATLAVSRRTTDRQLLVAPNGSLCGWHQASTESYQWASAPEKETRQLAFSGIAIVQRSLLNSLPDADHPYPIMPEYLRLAAAHPIRTFEHMASQWLDVGKPETLAKASEFMRTNKSQFSAPQP